MPSAVLKIVMTNLNNFYDYKVIKWLIAMYILNILTQLSKIVQGL
jgi:hypothetical protein